MGIKLPEVLTEEEIIKVLEATKSNKHRLAFSLGFYECMRVSEIVNLKPENIDKNTRLIKIKQAKGNKDRNIPIAPEVLKGLKYLPLKIGVRALQIAFKKKIKDVLGRDDLHFHSLRHSGITHYLTKKHWNSLEVQRLAGHSKISTTEIYTHISPQNLVDRMWEDKNDK
jgi:integrase/recombinase XerD